MLFRWMIGQWGGFPDFDGHFHLTLVYRIANQGLWAHIPWLPFTVLGEKGPDHQWLWHLMLLPFAAIGDADQALAWAAACNAAAVVAVTGFVMRMLGVPAAPLFAVLAVAAGTLMPYRLMMLRAQNIAIIFMMLSVWAMARGRHRALAAIAFLFLQSYHAAVILLPMALVGCAAYSLAERRAVAGPLIAVAGGAAAALLASPWFPRNIEYLLFHILFKTAAPLHGEQLSSLIGTEWYPPGWRNVLMQSWPAHLMLGAAIASQLWRRTFRPDTVLAAGVALLSLALYFGAVRFAEYYIPFSALAAGLAARDFSPARGMRIALVAWTVLAASVGLTQAARVALAPPDHLAKIGERLNQLGRPGEVVFNSSWSDFMALVWWAGGFRYINGLDGHYLAYADPARFAVWLALGSGQMDDPAGAIEAAFGARFAVVARQHERLARQLLASPRAALRVDSPEGWLFEIAPAGKPIPPAR